MRKTELTAMTVAELKALARKMKVSLPAGGKKSDVVDALIAAARPAAKQAAAKSKKTTTRKPKAKKPSPARKKPSKTAPAPKWKLPPGVEEPLMSQERIAESKYYTGPNSLIPAVASGHLPRGYNEERITLLSRDPFVAYAYWEATSTRIEREKAWFGWDSSICVRIYDITGVQFDGRNAIGYFDQEVEDRVGSWYFDFGRQSHSFCADIGLLSPEGQFLTIARSNYITMPRNSVSEVIDEEWMLVDEEFCKLYGYPEGFRRGISSPEIKEMHKQGRETGSTSPGLFSRDRAKRK